MFTLDSRSKQALYQQIMDQIVLLVSTGVLDIGDQLPSIRELASSLGINPNTVARAYTELEQKGIINTVPKVGAFVADISLTKEIKEEAKTALADLFTQYLMLGLTEDEIRSLVEEALANVENKELK
ncbi:MAG: GntR family transcriptional regulator [Saccharofermentanales bacterium]|nr:GntR family transcriptional regulator [Fastidiosipila sp.]